MKRIIIIGIFCIAILPMCKTQKTVQQDTHTPMMAESEGERPISGNPPATMAPALIYKTRADYNNYVPVTLNEQRSAIVSYPAPTDVYRNGELATPTPLENGYLLDNRGINVYSVFTSITYEEYAKLGQVTVGYLWSKIIDRTPMIELYHCGNRQDYTNEVEELNQVIQSGFKGCRIIEVPPSAVFEY